MMPQCQDIYEIDLYQQYNYNGKSTYTLNVILESDPAALQALKSFRILINEHHSFYTHADKFVSIKKTWISVKSNMKFNKKSNMDFKLLWIASMTSIIMIVKKYSLAVLAR